MGFGLMQVKGKNNLLPQGNRSLKTEEALSGVNSDTGQRYVIKEETRSRQRLFPGKNSAPSGAAFPSYKSNAISNTGSSLTRLKDYIKSVEEKDSFLKEKIDLLKNLLESREKEIARLNEDNAALKGGLDEAGELGNRLKSEFEGKLQALNAQLAQKDSDLAALNTIKLGLEYQAGDLNKKLSAISGSYDFLKKSLEDKSALETELSRIKEELKQQTALNETLNKNIADLTEASNNREKEKLDLIQELGKLKLSKKDAESGLEELKALKADTENQAAVLKSRLDELTPSYEKAKNSNLELSSLLSKKEAENALAISDKAREVSKLNEDNISLKDGLKRIIESQGKLKTDFEAKLQALEAGLAQKDSEVSKLNTIKISLEHQIEDLNKKLTVLSEAEAKKSSLQATELLNKKELDKELSISEKEKEIENVKDNLYKVSKERDAAALSLAEKEKNIRELSGKLDSLQPRLTAIQNELASGKEREAHVTEQLNQAMELNNSLKARLKNISAELEMLRLEKKMELTTEKKAVTKDAGNKDTSSYIKIRREIMP